MPGLSWAISMVKCFCQFNGKAALEDFGVACTASVAVTCTGFLNGKHHSLSVSREVIFISTDVIEV